MSEPKETKIDQLRNRAFQLRSTIVAIQQQIVSLQAEVATNQMMLTGTEHSIVQLVKSEAKKPVEWALLGGPAAGEKVIAIDGRRTLVWEDSNGVQWNYYATDFVWRSKVYRIGTLTDTHVIPEIAINLIKHLNLAPH